MLYEYMLKLGYNEEEIKDIISEYSLKNYKENRIYSERLQGRYFI